MEVALDAGGQLRVAEGTVLPHVCVQGGRHRGRGGGVGVRVKREKPCEAGWVFFFFFVRRLQWWVVEAHDFSRVTGGDRAR